MTGEVCQRCGRPVPARRRDTGFCTRWCARHQAKEDRESARMEHEQLEQLEQLEPRGERQ